MKKIIKSFFALSFVFVLCFGFFMPNVSLAQNDVETNTDFKNEVETPDKTVKITKLENPLNNIDSPQMLIGKVINSLFGIIGSLALVMFIYGGFLWMTSAGSSEQVKKGKDIFIWAVVGLVVVFSAYSIVRFVIEGIGA